MNKERKYDMDYALSGYDILRILDNNTNIISYNDLYNIENIDDVLKNGSCVILYNTGDNFGHWCCILTHPEKNKIEFFDPYGILIDDEIRPSFMPLNFIKKFYKKDKKRLRKLIYYSKYNKVEYNNYPLQKRSKNINTCGRHVVTRLIMKDLELEDYANFLYSFKRSPDEVVLSITNKFI